ncbi:Formate--tetrahydrofolate ligase [Nymphon striatum]|nr:Formate--tetrahydrofolate ligase [Nymphon striatum]
MAQHAADNSEEYRSEYGKYFLSKWGELLFGEPAINLDDMLKTDDKGRGIINILSSDKLFNSPQQVIRLIRSKAVGVYFVSQNPLDIPDVVLGQLGNRVQHALRAYTPRDQKAVKAAAETFRTNPEVDVGTAITELAVAHLCVPTRKAELVPANDAERAAVMAKLASQRPAKLKKISEVASKLGVEADDLIPYGHHMAKLSAEYVSQIKSNPDGKLILVTAMSPTPAGEGKTTTTIGLTDALNHIGKKALVCIREPSLGPVFGIKGGAAGGGYAQVVPMENINLHFTGDFHAITSANNLLAALIDNHIHHGNALDIDLENITWRRCVDMNDRALRNIELHQIRHETKSGFDISVASEVMAVFCLAESLLDLKKRLGNIQVAQSTSGKAILASDLQAEGAMTALLKDAFQPNLVQTLEHNPAIIHGGPFANIAHGCNSVTATKTALKMADYVVTEAGFGADLGAEKFFDIKCRQSGLKPDAVVIVATIRALKYHGGKNILIIYMKLFGMQAIVAINHFTHDTQAEVDAVKQAVIAQGSTAVVCKHWAEGGQGATELANCYIKMIDDLLSKIETIAQKVYGAEKVDLSEQAAAQLQLLSKDYSHLQVCIAKTQYSFSNDPKVRNAPTGHTLAVTELRLSRGAGFIVVICGSIMIMPGLPSTPSSAGIDVDALGNITGLS